MENLNFRLFTLAAVDLLLRPAEVCHCPRRNDHVAVFLRKYDHSAGIDVDQHGQLRDGVLVGTKLAGGTMLT